MKHPSETNQPGSESRWPIALPVRQRSQPKRGHGTSYLNIFIRREALSRLIDLILQFISQRWTSNDFRRFPDLEFFSADASHKYDQFASPQKSGRLFGRLAVNKPSDCGIYQKYSKSPSLWEALRIINTLPQMNTQMGCFSSWKM